MDFFMRLILFLYSVGLIFVLFSFKSLGTVLSRSASKSICSRVSSIRTGRVCYVENFNVNMIFGPRYQCRIWEGYLGWNWQKWRKTFRSTSHMAAEGSPIAVVLNVETMVAHLRWIGTFWRPTIPFLEFFFVFFASSVEFKLPYLVVFWFFCC